MGIFGDIGDTIDDGFNAAGDVLDSASGVATDVADHAGGFLLGSLGGPLTAVAGATAGVSGIVDGGKDIFSGVADWVGDLFDSEGDVKPAWEQSQPPWAKDLIAMCVASGKWPQASETALSHLADGYSEMAKLMHTGAQHLNTAKHSILDGWDAPAAETFDHRAKSNHHKLLTDGKTSGHLAEKADDYGAETEKTKVAINVAYWDALGDVFKSVVTAFFHPGDFQWGSFLAMGKLNEKMNELSSKLATTAGHPVAK